MVIETNELIPVRYLSGIFHLFLGSAKHVCLFLEKPALFHGVVVRTLVPVCRRTRISPGLKNFSALAKLTNGRTCEKTKFHAAHAQEIELIQNHIVG